jgi:hypothetical protein
MPAPTNLPSEDALAVQDRLRHWFVETGFSRDIRVQVHESTVAVEVEGSETGDDPATVVAQVAVLVPLMLPARTLAVSDVADDDGMSRLAFTSDPRRNLKPSSPQSSRAEPMP